MKFLIGLNLMLLLGQQCPVSAQCPVPRERKAWSKLSSDEQQAFLDAVVALKSSSTAGNGRIPYDDFVRTHAVNVEAAHSLSGNLAEEFLSWHRWFLWQYETALQSVSGKCVTLPVWEWERYSGNEEVSPPLDSSTFGSVDGIAGKYRGRWDYSVTEGIASCTDPSSPFQTTVMTGDCLERSFGSGTFTSQTGVMNLITSNALYADFFPALEGTPHAVPHNWVGRMMANVLYSPDDPLFFLHHANVDRIWALWQDYRDHDQKTADQMGQDEFSSDLDAPMAFGGVDTDASFFNSPTTGNYPTPREVLLNSGDLIQVTYVEDSLAQVLASAGVSYTPNSQWFTTTSTLATPVPSPEPTPGPTPAPISTPTTGPTPGPTGAPQPTSAPTPAPTPAFQQCLAANNACSPTIPCCGNCNGQNVCKGQRFLREQQERELQGPPIWANPNAQQRWQELLQQGVPPQAAIHTMTVEECGNNELTVPQEWIDQSALDEKYFRCYVE